MKPTKTALAMDNLGPDDSSLMCPRCVRPMVRQLRGSIEVDLCQTCKGVWLDHGELDAIMNRSLVEECYLRDLSDDGDLDLLPARSGAVRQPNLPAGARGRR